MDKGVKKRVIVLLLAGILVVAAVAGRPWIGKKYRFFKRNFPGGRTEQVLSPGGEERWYDGHGVIAHSCGSAPDGTVYTDSLESIEGSYERGIRLFDADISMTGDGIPVLKHEWTDPHTSYGDGVPDHDTFMNTKIAGKYTPVDCRMMLEYMAEHDDVYFVCDVKDDLPGVYSYIASEARSMGREDCLTRIIPSFYDTKDYEIIRGVHDFGGYAIRQYKNKTNNYGALIDFCVKNGIEVIMVDKAFIYEGDDLSPVLDAGIEVWAAVVNDLSEYDELKAKGVDGIVSDVLSEDDL